MKHPFVTWRFNGSSDPDGSRIGQRTSSVGCTRNQIHRSIFRRDTADTSAALAKGSAVASAALAKVPPLRPAPTRLSRAPISPSTPNGGPSNRRECSEFGSLSDNSTRTAGHWRAHRRAAIASRQITPPHRLPPFDLRHSSLTSHHSALSSQVADCRASRRDTQPGSNRHQRMRDE